MFLYQFSKFIKFFHIKFCDNTFVIDVFESSIAIKVPFVYCKLRYFREIFFSRMAFKFKFVALKIRDWSMIYLHQVLRL